MLTRAKLKGERGRGRLIVLGLVGGTRLERDAELEIDGAETVELEGRMLPAASLSASLLCSDGWDLPDTVAVRVFNAYDGEHELDPLDFEPDAVTGDDPGIAFANAGLILGGRTRDALRVGPFEQGVYYLAVKPQDFDRWTWAFEVHTSARASKLQVDVTGGGLGSDGALDNVDLGLFAVECAPAIDLLPAVAVTATPKGNVSLAVEEGEEATPVAFPDVREVEVDARFFDLDTDQRVGRRLSILRRDGRIQLRNCPGGRLRLDFTLSHPHFLPEPSLTWQVEMDLERGNYRQIAPEVEALGGAIVITGAGGSATLRGPNDLRRHASFEADEVLFPSLVPGRYRVEVSGTGGESVRGWRDLEVRVGETLRMDVRR